MPEELLHGLCILAVPVVAVTWSYCSGHRFVHSWAARVGFDLIQCSFSPMDNPFWAGSRVFRIVIRDKEGLLRSGYIRCSDLGSPDVIWDGDPHKRRPAKS